MSIENRRVTSENSSSIIDSWKPDDEKWMQSRREEWKKVQIRLSGATHQVPRSYWKHLKDYFFYGTPLVRVDKVPIDSYREICRWWLHPTGKNLGTFSVASCEDDIRKDFETFLGGLLSKIIREGDSEYGIMGVREQQIMLALNPGFNHLDIWKFGVVEEKACFSPYNLQGRCIGSTNMELRSYATHPLKPRPYHDMQYFANNSNHVLWDHFSIAMERDPREIYSDMRVRKNLDGTTSIDWSNSYDRGVLRTVKPVIDSEIAETLGSLFTFFDRPENDEARRRPQTVEHVEYLLQRYERKDFSDALLKRFHDAKVALKSAKSKQIFPVYFDRELQPFCLCRVRFQKKQQFEIARKMLVGTDETPIFVSEVEKRFQNMFTLLENVEMAHELDASEDILLLTLRWSSVSPELVTPTLNKIVSLGVSSLCGIMIDEKVSGISKVFVHDGEDTRVLEKWKRKDLKKVTRRTNIPRLLEEIEQSLSSK